MDDATRLRNLADAMVEDIMALSDEEVLQEVQEDGGDPDQIAAELRAMFEETLMDLHRQQQQ